MGQDLAVRQLVDAVCHHLATPHPPKPLVLSAHGPPGVGKTLTHQLLAQALYNKHPEKAVECPGRHCKGYKVVYGLDYLSSERDAQLDRLRGALLEHLRTAPESLLVIEEYDKLDCASRGMLRQLLQNPEIANATMNRAIVMLESNLGMSELQQLLEEQGSRKKITAEAAESRVKELVFRAWSGSGCETFADTLRLTGLIDFYLPYFPLERRHVEELLRRGLAARGAELQRTKHTSLEWDERIVQFLCSKIEFDGAYPLEGAKGVESVITRYVSRIARKIPAATKDNRATLTLSVAGDGAELVGDLLPEHEAASAIMEHKQPT